MSDMGNTDLGSWKMGNRGVSAMKGYRVPQSGYQMPTQKLGVNPVPKAETDVSGWGNLSKRITGSFVPKKLGHYASDLQAGSTGRGSFIYKNPAGYVPQIGED